MMMVSVVVTVKDEESTIPQLLNSLERQSLKPHEIIIVDGGSKDATVDVVKSFTNPGNSIRLIVANGTNRGEGRNIGISAATSEMIALTDAGVVLDEFWLENLIKLLIDGDADFVGGVYVQSGGNLLQKCIGILQYPNLTKLRAGDFLPSSRSVAFKKDVWGAVGRWPEHLEKAEDTYFDLMVKEKGFRIALAKNAVVSFPARDSLKKLFLQYSSYAEWDARARLLSKLKIYRLMALAYAFIAFSLFSMLTFFPWGSLFFFPTVLAYLTISGIKAFGKTRKLSSFLVAAAVKITIFFAESYGIAKGLISRVQKKSKSSAKATSSPSEHVLS